MSTNRRSVLILDDDRVIREQLNKELRKLFFTTFGAANAKEAEEILAREKIDIVVLDVKLPDINGLEVLTRIKQKQPECEVVVITGFGTQEIAIQSLRRGAIDYIEKPIRMDELSTALGRAQEKLAERDELSYKNTLLVVDDDEKTATRLKMLLEKEGYEAFDAYSGAAALDAMHHNKIDVMVSDIKIGDTDGVELLKKAKKLYQDIEGIMVTGYKDQELAIRALRAGAVDYITKPINLDELFLSVQRAIERINLNRNLLYRNREQKISSEIVSQMNEELERRIRERSKQLSQTQAQLFQTSKLATLGEMSAGLAHEMNQPLGGISLIARNFRKLHERGKLSEEEIESGLNDIETCVRRMTKIVQHIRTFARQDTLKFIKVTVNETIESALSLLGEQMRLHEIEAVTDLAGALPQITGEPYQLEQVWINLITNARDAVDEMGHHPETKGKKFRKKVSISTELREAGGAPSVLVHVKDNGIGMSEESREKIFEPFFTTKEVGKATGLGMSISYGIIDSHGGKIDVRSGQGKGTTVTVTLPIEDE
ncbi:response regulator [Verrucomicrobiota bacterium]